IRFRDQQPVAGFHPIYGNNVQVVDGIEKAFPDIRLATKWKEQWSATEALDLVGHVEEGEIVVESGKRGEGTARPGTVRILERTPGGPRVEAAAPGAPGLFALRGSSPPPRVPPDERRVKCSRARPPFPATRAPAGKHTIDWIERVPGGRLSRFAPVLFLLIA